jgi:hypothetical protein
MYEVVLEDDEGELTGFATDEARDEAHAAELAKISHPKLSVLGVLKLEEEP